MTTLVAEGHIRVLLVEDSPPDADLIRETLEEAAGDSGAPYVELVQADRLASAEALLAAESIDVVLLDLSLPDSHGLDTFRRLAARFPTVPVVVLTGLDHADMAARAVRAGAQDYLVKGGEDGRLVLRTLRYAVERRRAEAERAARSEAEAALRARDELLALISHDLKTPLTAIKMQAQMLLRRIERGEVGPTEPLLAGLTRIDRTTTQATRLIDELLDATRLEAGRPLELDREETDLVALADRMVVDWRQRSERHRIRLEAVEPALAGNWDARRLERVLANLLENAVKYSPGGGEIVVRVTREEDGPTAVLQVSDTGFGIPAADLPHVFERFFRARNVGEIPGTGIGLAGVRQIVEQHGGSISVESCPGAGSTFTVRLPL